MTLRRRALALSLVFAILLTGCGKKDAGGDSSGGSSSGGGNPGGNAGTQAGEGPGSGGAAGGPSGGGGESTPRTVDPARAKSLSALVGLLPKSLWPPIGKFGGADRAKAGKWFEENAADREVELTLQLAPVAARADVGDKWRIEAYVVLDPVAEKVVQLDIRPEGLMLGSRLLGTTRWPIKVVIETPIVVGEAEAKRWESLADKRVLFRAKTEAVGFWTDDGIGREVVIHLKDITPLRVSTSKPPTAPPPPPFYDWVKVVFADGRTSAEYPNSPAYETRLATEDESLGLRKGEREHRYTAEEDGRVFMGHWMEASPELKKARQSEGDAAHHLNIFRDIDKQFCTVLNHKYVGTEKVSFGDTPGIESKVLLNEGNFCRKRTYYHDGTRYVANPGSGKGRPNEMTSPQAEHFLKTFNPGMEPAGWARAEVPEAGFSIELPARPKRVALDRVDPGYGGVVKFHALQVMFKDLNYFAAVAQPDPAQLDLVREDGLDLEGERDRMLKQMERSEMLGEEAKRDVDRPSLDFQVETGRGQFVRVRLLAVDGRLVTLKVSGPTREHLASADAVRFLDSFRLAGK